MSVRPAVMCICADCQPAGVTVRPMDDLVGSCDGCGRRDGNLRPYAPPAFIAQRGHYVTATGRVVPVRASRIA